MAYELKRPVEISVRWVEERWAPRCLVPACWRAHIVTGGPRKFNGVVSEAPTRDAAIKAMIERLPHESRPGSQGARMDTEEVLGEGLCGEALLAASTTVDIRDTTMHLFAID